MDAALPGSPLINTIQARQEDKRSGQIDLEGSKNATLIKIIRCTL